MPETTVDPSIPLTAQSTWLSTLRNPYVNLPGVQATAEVAARHPSFLTDLALFVCNFGSRAGYTQKTLETLRRNVFLLRPPLTEEQYKQAYKALEQLGEDYEEAISRPTTAMGGARRLPSDFTSAISEAIVANALLRSGRALGEMVSDCHFRIGDGEQSATNIDIVWWRGGINRFDMYECKHGPHRLLEPWACRSYEGNHSAWEKSQLCLMLSVHGALTRAQWEVRTCCVTLRQREAIRDSIDWLGTPPELSVYCQEDLGYSFPPAV